MKEVDSWHIFPIPGLNEDPTLIASVNNKQLSASCGLFQLQGNPSLGCKQSVELRPVGKGSSLHNV